MKGLKEFFTKNKKAIFIGAILAAIVGAILYMRRKQPFYDNFFAGAMATSLGVPQPSPYEGNVGFTTIKPHGLKVGDSIIIQQDAGAINPQYDGEAKVVGILDANNFIIDKGFGTNTPANPGTYSKINLI